MPLLKLTLAYDGTPFFGWQKTKTGPSIQEELEKAIAHITGDSATPEAASRTDRGVHAEGQIAHVQLSQERDLSRLQRGLNAVLPPEIRVLQIDPANDDFHSTLHARGKEYHYRIQLGPVQDPIYRLYTWHFHYPLDIPKIEQAIPLLLGTHDFSAFANEREEDPTCNLQSIEIQTLEKDQIQFSLVGNRFLYKMVRNLVGTLVYIGWGKLSPDSILSILTSKDRKKGGITAPAHGLYLHKVLY